MQSVLFALFPSDLGFVYRGACNKWADTPAAAAFRPTAKQAGHQLSCTCTAGPAMPWIWFCSALWRQLHRREHLTPRRGTPAHSVTSVAKGASLQFCLRIKHNTHAISAMRGAIHCAFVLLLALGLAAVRVKATVSRLQEDLGIGSDGTSVSEVAKPSSLATVAESDASATEWAELLAVPPGSAKAQKAKAPKAKAPTAPGAPDDLFLWADS